MNNQHQPVVQGVGVRPPLTSEEVPDAAATTVAGLRDRLRANAAPILEPVAPVAAPSPVPTSDLPHESEPARVEVELKFRMPANANNSLRANVHHAARTKCVGFRVGHRVTEADEYYTSPTMQADTYLRIRTSREEANSWDEVQITWKGPLLGESSKSRREENVSLKGDDASALRRILTGLGYSRFASVYKEREHYKLQHAGFEITMTFDRVRGLGEFVELEVLTIEPARLGAESVLLDLARLLGLSQQERRGYAAMAVLAAQNAQPAESNKLQ